MVLHWLMWASLRRREGHLGYKVKAMGKEDEVMDVLGIYSMEKGLVSSVTVQLTPLCSHLM
jgi:hypothetical protein